jgi:hypothetical protein
MEPIHDAAVDGDVAAVTRLVKKDGACLDAQIEEDFMAEDASIKGCTPLMLATLCGRDAVVARLLALKADMELTDSIRWRAVHWACFKKRPSALALLIDAGCSLNEPDADGRSPLIVATNWNAPECVAVLLARGGDALDVNAATTEHKSTALHWAAYMDHREILTLLLQAGADPTIRNTYDRSPWEVAQRKGHKQCVRLLQAAILEPLRARTLLKARALVDAAVAIPKARKDAEDKGLSAAVQKEKAMAAAPSYLKGRVAAENRKLPHVKVDDKEEELVACVKYALAGMPKGVFVELCELLVPKWDRDDM